VGCDTSRARACRGCLRVGCGGRGRTLGGCEGAGPDGPYHWRRADKLQRISGMLSLFNNPSLQSAALPALQSVGMINLEVRKGCDVRERSGCKPRMYAAARARRQSAARLVGQRCTAPYYLYLYSCSCMQHVCAWPASRAEQLVDERERRGATEGPGEGQGAERERAEEVALSIHALADGVRVGCGAGVGATVAGGGGRAGVGRRRRRLGPEVPPPLTAQGSPRSPTRHAAP
jgi:hypothetical protein